MNVWLNEVRQRLGFSHPVVLALFALANEVANTSGFVPASRVIGTTFPLTGGGDLSANRTLGLALDGGSLTVGGLGLKVGVISDAQHGNRSGGALHALATAVAAGFMSSADKAALDAIPTLYQALIEKGAPLGYASLDASGKIPSSQLPAIAITETFVAASQPAMLALPAQTGDVCVRTDLSETFILAGTNPSVLADWQQLLQPGAPVQSVFGRAGNVVAQAGDYSALQVTFTPNGNITATEVQSAIAQVRDASVQDGDAAGGQLGGTFPNPDVRGFRETSGPTLLSYGAVADGSILMRSGTSVVGGPTISDAQHGNRGGGALHALATPTVAGFMSGADKDALDKLVAPITDLALVPIIGGPTLTTRAPGVVLEGAQMFVPRRTSVANVKGRFTGFTTLGAGLLVALYQVPGGLPVGTAALIGQGTVTPGAIGAQDFTIALGATQTLEAGFVYVLYGRTNATAGVTLRTWTIGAIERLTANLSPGDVPITFTTAIPSTGPAPATLAVPGALVASTVSPALCGRITT